MAKIIIIGLGSIGRRHAKNALALGYSLVCADPYAAAVPGVVWYTDWRRSLAEHGDAQGCIIASPTDAHLEQLFTVARGGVDCYIEKPVMTAGDYERLNNIDGLHMLPLDGIFKNVTGFQYLFHPAMPAVEKLARRYGAISFVGCDRLLARYGPDVDGVMVAHPIATALRFLGPAVDVNLMSNGVQLSGHIVHAGGKVSRYDFDMDRGPRESWARANGAEVALTPDDGMYVAALAAWTTWLGGGPRDQRLSSLSDGLEVTRTLAKVSHLESAESQRPCRKAD